MADDYDKNWFVNALLRKYSNEPVTSARALSRAPNPDVQSAGPLTPMNKLLLDVGLTSQDPFRDEGRRLALGLMGTVRLPAIWRSAHPSTGIAEYPGAYDLPMDQASRLARAKQQGYDTSKTWYHGTEHKFDAFDPMDPGTYFSSDPHYASTYGDNLGAYHVRGKIKEVDLPHEPDIDKHIENMDNALAAAAREGYSGVRYMDNGREVEMVVPSHLQNRIRSTDAAFDPTKSNIPNLLAGLSAAAPLAGITTADILSRYNGDDKRDDILQLSGRGGGGVVRNDDGSIYSRGKDYAIGSDYVADKHSWDNMDDQERHYQGIAEVMRNRGWPGPGQRESTHVEEHPGPGVIGADKPATPDPEPSLWDNFLLNMRRAWPTPLNLPGPRDPAPLATQSPMPTLGDPLRFEQQRNRTIIDDEIRNAKPMDDREQMKFLDRYTPRAQPGDRIQLPNKWDPTLNYGIPYEKLSPHQWYEFNPEYDPPWALVFPSSPGS